MIRHVSSYVHAVKALVRRGCVVNCEVQCRAAGFIRGASRAASRRHAERLEALESTFGRFVIVATECTPSEQNILLRNGTILRFECHRQPGPQSTTHVALSMLPVGLYAPSPGQYICHVDKAQRFCVLAGQVFARHSTVSSRAAKSRFDLSNAHIRRLSSSPRHICFRK